MNIPSTRALAVALACLAGCQNGFMPKPKAAQTPVVEPAGTASAQAKVELPRGAAASNVQTADMPRVEPGDFAEGYTQPKGSPIPPVLPAGRTIQTSAVK